MRDLSKTYPADQIQEGLRRLLERRYVIQATPSTTGTVAGFWASLGLPPEMAEQNLAASRVRVEERLALHDGSKLLSRDRLRARGAADFPEPSSNHEWNEPMMRASR